MQYLLIDYSVILMNYCKMVLKSKAWLDALMSYFILAIISKYFEGLKSS